ncbi:MAG: hypothetical protein SOW25_07440 [Helicobacter sp.]|nr:hypothetical protein [Helicobacter sp.]
MKNMKIGGGEFDYYLYVRPDISFSRPLLLSKYIDDCKRRGYFLNNHHVFGTSNIFGRMEISHPNFPAETSLCFYSNKKCAGSPYGQMIQTISINYFLYVDLFICREFGEWKLSAPNPLLKTMLRHPLLLDIIKQNQKEASSDYDAKRRVKNHLAYKLGVAIIDNSKSLFGFVRLPFVLSYIAEKHKAESQIYKDKIATNPTLKLPMLESLKNYKEGLKVKEHLSYKIGELFLIYRKLWWCGGLAVFYFKVKALAKKHNKKR